MKRNSTVFTFTTIGQLVASGRRTGLAQILGRHFSGFVTWWLWRTVYLVELRSFEKRLCVAQNWTPALLFKGCRPLRFVFLPWRKSMSLRLR